MSHFNCPVSAYAKKELQNRKMSLASVELLYITINIVNIDK